MAARLGHRLADGAGCGDMVLLDQDAIVEAHAVVVAAATGDGIFLCPAHAGQCLAGIENPDVRPFDLFDITAGYGGGA